MARKERKITVKVIENKRVYDKLLVDFFAKKYTDNHLDNSKQK